jgi:hypothetical protein
MTNDRSIDLDVQVSVITSVRKRELETSFVYPSPAPAAFDDKREIDPNVIAVQLRHPQNSDFEFVLNMLMTRKYAERLGLLVGDKLKLRLMKES